MNRPVRPVRPNPRTGWICMQMLIFGVMHSFQMILLEHNKYGRKFLYQSVTDFYLYVMVECLIVNIILLLFTKAYCGSRKLFTIFWCMIIVGICSLQYHISRLHPYYPREHDLPCLGD